MAGWSPLTPPHPRTPPVQDSDIIPDTTGQSVLTLTVTPGPMIFIAMCEGVGSVYGMKAEQKTVLDQKDMR